MVGVGLRKLCCICFEEWFYEIGYKIYGGLV
jgi:hypothetical protein